MPRHWLAGLSLGCLYLINLLPYPIKIRVGIGIGKLTYLCIRRRKHIADVNLKICFPELSDAERQQLLRRAFDNFGAGLIETAMGWWSPEAPIHKMTEYIGIEHLEAAIAKGKGVILVGAHFVNYVLERGRSGSLLSLINNRDSRRILKTIRAGEMVWFAPDHDMGERLSVYAPFFEKNAATVTVTGRYAKLTGAPAIFCAHHRKPDNSGYTLRVTPLQEDFASLDDIEAATLVNQSIAEHILIDPAQYYWFHRRFKTQPSLPVAALY